MTFHGTNRLKIHNPHKRTMGNTNNMNLNTTPIAIQTNNNNIYKSSCVMSNHLASSINLKPVHIGFSEPKNRKESQQKYDVIDVSNLSINNKDIETINIRSNSNHRHYRNNPSNSGEIFDLFKWCLFCLTALGSCIIFISYLLQITGNNINHLPHSNKPHNKKFLPHHIDEHYGGYHQFASASSIGNSYMGRKSTNINKIAIENINSKHKHKHNNLKIINNNNKELKLTNINIEKQFEINNNKNNKYHLVRNDKYSILNDILFIVFKSNINNDNIDGREIILNTWGKKYKDLYDINIKFVNTMSNKFLTNEYGNLYDNVIEAPFISESGMCLLWVIDEYTDGYKWIFKLDDITFIMIENLVDYLNEIELESSLLAHNNINNLNDLDIEHHYYWWLGNRLQKEINNKNSIFTSGGAGYLLNRAIIDLIVNDIRNDNTNSNNNNKYDKYMMCKQHGIICEDLCVAYLLNEKYNIYSTNTLDMDNNEKFNVFEPMILFGFGGLYKLPIDWYTKYKQNIGEINNNNIEKETSINYISKTPITFNYVLPKWMNAYYELFYLNKNANNIQIIKDTIGENNKQINILNEYAHIVIQHSLTNHIKNIKNEMKHITTDLNYNLVK